MRDCAKTTVDVVVKRKSVANRKLRTINVEWKQIRKRIAGFSK